MLYVTTRNKADSFTAHRTLHQNYAADGGYFVPYKLNQLSQTEIDNLKDQSFGETVAQVLNLFFSTGITGWDVDCCIGKTPVRMISVSHRILLAQLWNNPLGDYNYITNKLYEKLCAGKPESEPTEWAVMAIRIAVLFGVYGAIAKMNMQRVDISVNSGDFSVPMAAWYAKEMGLPIGNIICACNENGTAWDFIHRGEISTGASVIHTALPELDVVNPAGFERLLYSAIGSSEAKAYADASCQKKTFIINTIQLQQINHDLSVSVVGSDRITSVISSFYSTTGCVLDPYTALSYGGLQDYRAKTGESTPTVLLWDKNPAHYPKIILDATGLTADDLEKSVI